MYFGEIFSNNNSKQTDNKIGFSCGEIRIVVVCLLETGFMFFTILIQMQTYTFFLYEK